MADQKGKIVAVLSDLIFRVKILEAAKRAGLEPVFVESQQDALAKAKEKPAVVILDLNYSAGEPLDTIAKLKNDRETSEVKLLGFVSHVQANVILEARRRGCDQVIARSAFSRDLPEILGRYVEH